MEALKLKLLLLNILGANLIYIHNGVKTGGLAPAECGKKQKEICRKMETSSPEIHEKENHSLYKK